MAVRRSRAFLKLLHVTLLVALDLFVGGGTTDLISSTQVYLGVIVTQRIGDKLNLFILGVGLFSRYWQVPPCLCLLNCKPCARFVL